MDIEWQGSIEIAAPVERVYAYLADFPRHCEWAQTLERMEQTKPGSSSGVGAVYRTYERQGFQSDRLPRGPLPEKASKGTTVCEVRELEPNRRIAWHADATPKVGVHADLAFDLAPTNVGATRLTQTIRMHQPWLMTKVFPLMFKLSMAEMDRRAREQWQASLRNIKAIMEEDAAAVAASD